MLNYSLRIQKLSELAAPCNILGDVGTDHGFVPIYMIQRGLCSGAVASDINRGPLRKAEEDINKTGTQSKIELRLGEGLAPYAPGECDTFVIAGMGGSLIGDILAAKPEVARKAEKLVLQPNTCRAQLREFLNDNGYEITDENCMGEKDHVYLFITAKYTGAAPKKLTYADLEMGSILQNKPEGVIYFRALHKKISRKAAGLRNSLNPCREEIEKAENLLSILEEYI